jgi:hypothetical protein
MCEILNLLKMKNKYRIIFLSIFMVCIFILTLLRTPEQVSNMLNKVTSDMSSLAVIVHIIYWIVIVVGLLFKRIRTIAFSSLLLILSGTATVVSIKYFIIPNILIFLSFLILTIIATYRKELNFDSSSLKPVNKIVGFTALFFGSYYLHWVETPVFLNALVYSPLGVVNCPTMVAYCGFLCFLGNSRNIYLDFFVATITLYFGFYGIMRLGAYVDVILVITGAFLLTRLLSNINSRYFYYQ